MIVKYNIANEISDATSTNIKWVLPKTFTLTTDYLYQYNSVIITKGSPFTLTIDPLYTLRYIVINSDNSFTININNSFELLTNTFTLDVGPNRTGFTNITNIENILITNPTGQSGPIGNQFANPTNIEVRYILVLEKI